MGHTKGSAHFSAHDLDARQKRRLRNNLWRLLFRIGRTKRKLVHQKLPLIAIQELEQNDGRNFLSRVGNVLGTKVVIAPCFRGEMERRCPPLRAQSDKALPARAE